jgi:hypothetical protein
MNEHGLGDSSLSPSSRVPYVVGTPAVIDAQVTPSSGVTIVAQDCSCDLSSEWRARLIKAEDSSLHTVQHSQPTRPLARLATAASQSSVRLSAPSGRVGTEFWHLRVCLDW